MCPCNFLNPIRSKLSFRRTGIVYNVTPSAVGVIVYKVVGNRYLEKRVNLRVEHVRHSKCRQEFLDRVKSNHEAHVAAKASGGRYSHTSVIEIFLIIDCRTYQPPPYPCPSPRVPNGVRLRKCPSDDRACAIRDYYLMYPYFPLPWSSFKN